MLFSKFDKVLVLFLLVIVGVVFVSATINYTPGSSTFPWHSLQQLSTNGGEFVSVDADFDGNIDLAQRALVADNLNKVCAPGQIIQYNGASWICANATTGGTGGVDSTLTVTSGKKLAFVDGNYTTTPPAADFYPSLPECECSESNSDKSCFTGVDSNLAVGSQCIDKYEAIVKGEVQVWNLYARYNGTGSTIGGLSACSTYKYFKGISLLPHLSPILLTKYYKNPGTISVNCYSNYSPNYYYWRTSVSSKYELVDQNHWSYDIYDVVEVNYSLNLVPEGQVILSSSDSRFPLNLVVDGGSVTTKNINTDLICDSTGTNCVSQGNIDNDNIETENIKIRTQEFLGKSPNNTWTGSCPTGMSVISHTCEIVQQTWDSTTGVSKILPKRTCSTSLYNGIVTATKGGDSFDCGAFGNTSTTMWSNWCVIYMTCQS